MPLFISLVDISTVNPDPLKCGDFGRQSVARNLADFGGKNFAAFVKQLQRLM